MFTLRPERPDDGPAIEALLDTAFGPGRFAKTAYRLREGVPPVEGLSFVAEEDGALIGSIRYWPVSIGGRAALMLGPIAVLSSQRGRGIAVGLMQTTLEAAAKAGLADYKHPREYIRVEALPRTNTGKIDRRRLREDHRKG